MWPDITELHYRGHIVCDCFLHIGGWSTHGCYCGRKKSIANNACDMDTALPGRKNHKGKPAMNYVTTHIFGNGPISFEFGVVSTLAFKMRVQNKLYYYRSLRNVPLIVK